MIKNYVLKLCKNFREKSAFIINIRSLQLGTSTRAHIKYCYHNILPAELADPEPLKSLNDDQLPVLKEYIQRLTNTCLSLYMIIYGITKLAYDLFTDSIPATI